MYRQQVELRKQLIKRSNKPWNPIAINHMIIETFFFFILLVKHLIYRTYIKKSQKLKLNQKNHLIAMMAFSCISVLMLM